MERVEGKDNPQRSNPAVNTSRRDHMTLLLLCVYNNKVGVSWLKLENGCTIIYNTWPAVR